MFGNLMKVVTAPIVLPLQIVDAALEPLAEIADNLSAELKHQGRKR